jgi:hypothetical protein
VTVASRKMIVKPASRMLSAISFGVFWRLRPRPSRSCGRGTSRRDRPRPDDEPVRQDARAARDGAAVAAGLADDGCALAGDRALVDRRDADDDLAVARDELARLDEDEVALAEVGARRP